MDSKVYVIIIFDSDSGKHLSRLCYRSWDDVNRFMRGFNPDVDNFAIEISSVEVANFVNEQ